MATDPKTSSSSDEALYLTDDLVGRLDPESLTREPLAELVPGGRVLLGTQTEEEAQKLDQLLAFYGDQARATPAFPVSVVFWVGGAEVALLDSSLQLLSFGKDGWRANVDVLDGKACLSLVKHAASLEAVELRGVVKLSGSLDVTLHFGDSVGCSVSIAADVGEPT